MKVLLLSPDAAPPKKKRLGAPRVPWSGQSWWLSSAALLLAATALFLLGACAQRGTLPTQTMALTTGTLAPGDVIRLSFPGASEMNQSQKIRADGKISLPLVGEFQAGGKKLGAMQVELSSLYKGQLKNTEVLVVLESSAIPIYVTGAVNRPGKVVLDRPMTVLEAIMEAGGESNLANLGKVVVIRNTEGRHLTQTFDLSAPLKGHPTTAFYLRPYDMIYVPERFF